MGGAGCLACRGLRNREAYVGVLVGGAGFFSIWSAVECPVVSFEMGLWLWCDFGQPVY